MDEDILNCRLCSSDRLEKLMNFGDIALGNNLLNTLEQVSNVKKYPLELQRCLECNHYQLSYSVNPETLYATNYTYLSSIGTSFLDHIKNFVKWLNIKCDLSKNKFVLDIGSNDGTCLKEFKKLGCVVCGVDPAQTPAKIANENGVFTYNDFFSDDIAKKIIEKFGRPFLISSQNALAHIHDIKGTFLRIYNLLQDDGFFVFEVGYFLSVLENRLFDTIYHEHLDYHHAFPLVKYLSHIGFSVSIIDKVESQGGSIRLLCQKNNLRSISKDVKNFIDHECNSVIFKKNYIGSWLKDIKNQLHEVKVSLIEKKKKGFQIVAYGAPTKATLLLKLAELERKDINFIIEDNALKAGKFLPNGIPIKLLKDINFKTNTVILILAWNFANDIIKKLIKLNFHADIIIPLPNLRKITI